MIYSELYFKQKTKIPTVIGFLLTVFVAVFFSKYFLGLTGTSKASLRVAKRVEVVNLSPGQISIFWQTDQNETGKRKINIKRI